MVQKRVPAQGWLGSTPEGQRPQIRGLRAGGSLAVASSIPATQLSSPARLAERVVTPHAPMTLGANHGSRAPERGRPGRCWCSPAWPPGPRQGWATGFDSSPRADNTSVRAGGVLSVGIPRFSTNLNILRAICSGHGDPARRAAATAAPSVHRGSTHAPRLQRPVASEDEASACSEAALGCHPETPVIEPCPNLMTDNPVSYTR